MNLHSLNPAKGSVNRNDNRKGRGQGSGKGGTATRGHKGAKSRSGYSKKVGFEGGQMPLQRRVPKFGFTNINRVSYQPINLDTIQELIDSGKFSDVIKFEDFVNSGLVTKNDLVKILGRGELKSKVSISAHRFSSSAISKLESVSGEAITL